MPLHCVEERRSPTQLDEEEDDPGECTCIWQDAPDSLLLHIFTFLEPTDLAIVSQTCKKWKRVSYDECLWRDILKTTLKEDECTLPPDKSSWRSEVIRILYHTPTVLTETLHEHTDEVLHISFSHDGNLFSTTSKDATLKVWTVGHPTTLKFSKDFRELLGWDFTQFSCFNETDTMVLVSSVKTSSYMDRRGFMAILSIVHDFEILRVVTMDPSQLFGAWLDATTFLGGSLEISLDRFATTVQIEAYDVPEIFSPLPRLSPTPMIEESSGKHLFTFSSETASLIKFLTVAEIVPKESHTDKSPSSEAETESVHLAELSPNTHICRENEPCCSSADFTSKLTSGSSYLQEGLTARVSSEIVSAKTRESSYAAKSSTRSYGEAEDFSSINDDTSDICDRSKEDKFKTDEENESETCDICKKQFRVQNKLKSGSICSKCREEFIYSERASRSADTKDSCSVDREFLSCEYKLDVMGAEREVKMDCDSAVKHNRPQRPNKLEAPRLKQFESRNTNKPRKYYRDLQENDQFSQIPDNVTSGSPLVQAAGKQTKEESQKNLIFVTGEFAVALHQLGFKNVVPYSKESILARGVTPMDEDNPEGFMVVNYSNNDIHIVRRQQETDKPDNLIDLFGHVTGLCLTADQRYLFINCRPWIGDVDRTDPWATPDLSPNIEVRIIDLLNLRDLGVRYVGHKGFSPSNMCCFVFLDVSDDYVASGSEDAKGYLWDRHYRALLANYDHESGVVNAVGFNPKNQEYFATVSDDGLVKIWRSKHEVKQLNL